MLLTDISLRAQAVIGQSDVQIHPKAVLGLLIVAFWFVVIFLAARYHQHRGSDYKALAPTATTDTASTEGPILVTSGSRIGQRLTEALASGGDLRVVHSDGTGRTVASARAVVAVVDDAWRGSGPSEDVTRELAAAFKANVLVVPVLVDQAAMPTKEQLSPALHRFAELHYNQIRSGHFDVDVDVVARVLREH